jgi:hypothetical protein
MEGVLHTGELRLMLTRLQLEQRRAALAAAFGAWPWRHFNLANLVYVVLDHDVERRLAETDQALAGAGDRRDAGTGARVEELTFATDAEMLAYLVDLWQRSSRLLDTLARANGARYYHFLQPNQYVPGAKPMDAGERAQAYRPNHHYRRVVEGGYPLLQRAGRALAADGVRFTDLTAAFAEHLEPVYVDSCCHVNPHGNAILADAIFDTIRRDLDRAR